MLLRKTFGVAFKHFKYANYLVFIDDNLTLFESVKMSSDNHALVETNRQMNGFFLTTF